MDMRACPPGLLFAGINDRRVFMLLKNGRKPDFGFAGRTISRYIRHVLLALNVLFVIGCTAFVVSEIDSSGESRVYAVDTSSEGSGRAQQFQTGLMAVMNGVENMEQYSDATRLLDVADANEEVLAGLGKVDRRQLNRTSIAEGMKAAEGLGYYAQQTVYENQMSSDEYYTLLQIVEAEATGGDMMSKMMVAGVVLNRVRDPHFPDTISDVVWQDSQFQPTQDGRIHSVSVTDSTVEAVERVLQGEDYSQGALFFVARDSAEQTNLEWFDSSLVWLFEYGGHDYYTFKDYVDNI